MQSFIPREMHSPITQTLYRFIISKWRYLYGLFLCWLKSNLWWNLYFYIFYADFLISAALQYLFTSAIEQQIKDIEKLRQWWRVMLLEWMMRSITIFLHKFSFNPSLQFLDIFLLSVKWFLKSISNLRNKTVIRFQNQNLQNKHQRSLIFWFTVSRHWLLQACK